MPVIRSAKKAVRQTRVRRLRNKNQKASLYKQIALVKKQGNKGLVRLYSLADKAAKNHVIHPKKAARIKSRLTKKES